MKVAIIVESVGLAFYEPIQELLIKQIDNSGDPNSRGATLKYRIGDPESGFAADPNRHMGKKQKFPRQGMPEGKPYVHSIIWVLIKLLKIL